MSAAEVPVHLAEQRRGEQVCDRRAMTTRCLDKGSCLVPREANCLHSATARRRERPGARCPGSEPKFPGGLSRKVSDLLDGASASSIPTRDEVIGGSRELRARSRAFERAAGKFRAPPQQLPEEARGRRGVRYGVVQGEHQIAGALGLLYVHQPRQRRCPEFEASVELVLGDGAPGIVAPTFHQADRYGSRRSKLEYV
jgi:hypothetical protein